MRLVAEDVLVFSVASGARRLAGIVILGRVVVPFLCHSSDDDVAVPGAKPHKRNEMIDGRSRGEYRKTKTGLTQCNEYPCTCGVPT